MKKNTLIYLGIAAGIYLLLAMKKKKKGYKITVPEPDKITEEQFYQEAAQPVQPDVQVQSNVDQSIYGFVGRYKFPDIY